MPIIVACDGGCGRTTQSLSEFKEYGIVKKVRYCEDCAPKLDTLYDARKLLHTQHAKALATDALTAVVAFKKLLPKARLPDEPE